MLLYTSAVALLLGCDNIYDWSTYINKVFFLFSCNSWRLFLHLTLCMSCYIYIYIFIVRPCESCWILLQCGMIDDIFTFTSLALYIFVSEICKEHRVYLRYT